MGEIGSILELLYGLDRSLPSFEGQVLRRTYREGVLARAERARRYLESPTVLRAPHDRHGGETRLEVQVSSSGQWRARDARTGQLSVFDGQHLSTVLGRHFTTNIPTYRITPLGQLIDPSFLLGDRRYSVGAQVIVAGRAGQLVDATWRQNAVTSLTTIDREEFIVDVEWGILLRYKQYVEDQLLSETEFTHIHLMAIDPRAFSIDPPPDAVVTDYMALRSGHSKVNLRLRINSIIFATRQALGAMRGELYSDGPTGYRYLPRQAKGHHDD